MSLGLSIVGLVLLIGGIFVGWSIVFSAAVRALGLGLLLVLALREDNTPPLGKRLRFTSVLISLAVLVTYAVLIIGEPFYFRYIAQSTTHFLPIERPDAYVIGVIGSMLGVIIALFAIRARNPLGLLAIAFLAASFGMWANGYPGLLMLLIGTVIVIVRLVEGRDRA
ncbi:MAG: hypothetical protein Q4G30_09040 [Actinomycetaceae bacterium]|nr:hypothetical protein [Actinomycetaceae bacterium]